MRALECTQKGEPEKEAATLGTKEGEGSELVSVHTRGEGTPEDRLTTPSGRIREAADHCWPRVASSSSQQATRGPHHLSRVARTRSLLATRGQQTVPAGHACPAPEFLLATAGDFRLATRGQQNISGWPRARSAWLRSIPPFLRSHAFLGFRFQGFDVLLGAGRQSEVPRCLGVSRQLATVSRLTLDAETASPEANSVKIHRL